MAIGKVFGISMGAIRRDEKIKTKNSTSLFFFPKFILHVKKQHKVF